MVGRAFMPDDFRGVFKGLSGINARPTSILFHQPLGGEPPLFHLPLVYHDFRLPLIIKGSLKKQNRLVLSQTVFYWMD